MKKDSTTIAVRVCINPKLAVEAVIMNGKNGRAIIKPVDKANWVAARKHLLKTSKGCFVRNEKKNGHLVSVLNASMLLKGLRLAEIVAL